jgi:hypothetical protein
MEQVATNMPTVTVSLESSKTTDAMGLACLPSKMEIDMRVNLKMTNVMDEVPSPGFLAKN